MLHLYFRYVVRCLFDIGLNYQPCVLEYLFVNPVYGYNLTMLKNRVTCK